MIPICCLNLSSWLHQESLWATYYLHWQAAVILSSGPVVELMMCTYFFTRYICNMFFYARATCGSQPRIRMSWSHAYNCSLLLRTSLCCSRQNFERKRDSPQSVPNLDDQSVLTYCVSGCSWHIEEFQALECDSALLCRFFFKSVGLRVLY